MSADPRLEKSNETDCAEAAPETIKGRTTKSNREFMVSIRESHANRFR